MATRSRIGVMHGDVVKHVYCHWDGYPAHNGAILQTYYNSPLVNNLIALGDISSLKPEIGEQHDFDWYQNKESYTAEQIAQLDQRWTTFYYRDRGEEHAKDWKVSTSFEDFLEHVEGCCAEWYYIMKDGVWYVGNVYERDSRHCRKLVPLTETLELEAAEEAV